MRRKTKRTRLRPTPFLVILLVVNLATGFLASSLTVIRHIQVIGANDWERHRLESILFQLKGKPCAQINRYNVETLVLEDPAFKSAHFDRDPFGSAVLTVEHHTPVARFYNHLTMGLSDAGVVFRSDHLPEDLPTIQLGEGDPRPFMTLANDFPTASVAYVAKRIKQILPRNLVRIQYGTGSSLCLNIGTDQIILGSCDELDVKLGKLQEKLDSDPEFLSKIKSFNLLNPGTPMTVPR